MAAVVEEMVRFHRMKEAQLRQWVEANPGRVNDRDRLGRTPLYVAACEMESLPLTLWLLDDKGADVNATTLVGPTPLYVARSLGHPDCLVGPWHRPHPEKQPGLSPLMWQAGFGTVENVARLLQGPRVRATVNVQNVDRNTALHLSCANREETTATSITPLLLQAGSNPALTNNRGETPLESLPQEHPSHHTTIALFKQYPEAQKASLLVKARRLVVVSRKTVAPSYLQARVARSQPLPRVTLKPVTDGQDEEDEEDEEDKESRKLHTLMAFLLGMEGGWENAGMPRDVFRVVLDLLMPSWDPLRRKNAGTALPPVQEG